MLEEFRDLLEQRKEIKREKEQQKKDRGPNILLQVKQDKIGISTYAYERIGHMHPTYKGQLVAFLEGVLVEIKGSKKK